MAKELTEEQRKKYIQKPDNCPYCNSRDLERGSVHDSKKYVSRKIECEDCSASWIVIYSPTYIVTKED